MSADFVTIATFQTPPPAHLALGLLREAGIEAMLRNENIVAGAWDLGQATRGVEVRVSRDDALRARALVEQAKFRGGVAGDLGSDDEDDGRTPQERQDSAMADRAVSAAALGIVFPPLQLYSLWLLVGLKSRLTDARATPAIRKRMRDALLMDMVVIIILAIVVKNLV